MNLKPLNIHGCYEIIPIIYNDNRGIFIKTFATQIFADMGLNDKYCEDFFTISKKGVIRGMHFQIPPKEQTKLVFCVYGSVLDVILDMRVGSSSYHKTESIILSGDDTKMLYLPPGIAHGFLALTDDALVMYKVSCGYFPDYDKGVRWDSIDYDWTINSPIVSERDSLLPNLSDFKNPFVF